MVKCINVGDAQNNVLAEQKLADVAELADAIDLGSTPCVKPKCKMQNAECRMQNEMRFYCERKYNR